MKITFLHLSDLHLSEDTKHDQKVVLEALFRDVRAIRKEGVEFDAVIFTGDLISKGKYSAMLEQWVKEDVAPNLLDAAGVTRDRFFIVPGNHDMELPKRDDFLLPSVNHLATREEVNSFIDKSHVRPYLWHHMESYQNLRNSIGANSPIFQTPLFQAYSFEKDGCKVGIGCLNSAWKASGAAKDADYGQLIVGERQIEMIADSLKHCNLKLALVHHPLAWLAPFDGSRVQRAIFHHFDALFYGHNHSAEALLTAQMQLSLFFSNAGCLYQTRDFINAYSLVEHDSESGKWTVRVREYFEPRRLFDICSRFATNGQATFFPIKGKLGGGAMLALPSEQYLLNLEEKVNALLLTGVVSEVAPKSVNAYFVEPIIRGHSERAAVDSLAKEKTAEEESLSVRRLFASGSIAYIVGPKESGKTTLLAYLCANAVNPDMSSRPTFGVYVNFESLRLYTRASLLEAIVTFGAGEIKRSDFIALLGDGQVTLCIDNLPLRNEKAITLIVDFVKEFPKTKYVFTSLEHVETSIAPNAIPKFALPVVIGYIQSFGRKQTRQLVEKWFGESKTEVRTRVEGILKLMQRLNVPRTPFLVTILLWIQERKIPFSPVNQAALLDTFVDGLLEKLYESKARGAIDTPIKRHFLSELALHMHRQRTRTLATLELEKFTVSYFESKALPISALTLLEEFYQKGLLLDLGGDICFKFDCFRSFFLAQRLESARDLFEEATSPQGLHTLAPEIDLFTGLHRDRGDLLAKYLKILEDSYEPIALDIPQAVFDDVGAEGSWLSPEKREMIMHELVLKRPSFEEQEEFLDDVDDQVRRRKPPSKRQENLSINEREKFRVFIEALRICSVVLRNSELVDDAKLKHRAYEKVVHLWSEMLIGIVLTVEVSDEEEIKPLFEHLPISNQTENGLAHFRHFAKLLIPMVVLAIMREALATPKLESVMSEHLSKTPHNVQRLMDTFLYVDMELPKYIDKLEQLSKELKSRYELEIVFLKTSTIFSMRSLSESEVKRFEKLLGDLYSKIGSVGNKKRDDAQKAAFIALLSKKHLRATAINRSEE